MTEVLKDKNGMEYVKHNGMEYVKHNGETIYVGSYRNEVTLESKEEQYSNAKIHAWRISYEEFDIKKNDWIRKNDGINVVLYRDNKKPLFLNNCNNGDKFTSVNQAINQAKEFVDVVNKFNW